MHQLDCGHGNDGPSFLDRIRSKWIHNAAHGLRIAGQDRTAAQKYRCQSATVWNTPDGSESIRTGKPAEETSGETGDGMQKVEEEAAALAQAAIDLLRGQAAVDDLVERSDHRALEYYEATRLALQRIFQPSENATPKSPLALETAQTLLRSHPHQTNDADIARILSQLKDDANDLPLPESPTPVVHGEGHRQAEVSCGLLRSA